MKKITRAQKGFLDSDRKFRTKEWEVVKDTVDFICVKNKKTGEIIRKSRKERSHVG